MTGVFEIALTQMSIFHQVWVPCPLSLCLVKMGPLEVEEEVHQVRKLQNCTFNNIVVTSGYQIHPASTSPGGGAIRTRISGERRWENSPYGSDRNYYSSSLVSTYLSPPPESRFENPSNVRK